MERKQIVKEYSNEDITVIWKPKTCIHSKKCWKGLLQVFNPQNRPWVNMDGASTARIKKQVDACPSGALTYVNKHEDKEKNSTTTNGKLAEGNHVTLIDMKENGPLIVHGNLEIKDTKGNTVTHSNKTALCRCGASSNKPLCDGSHAKVDFKAN